MHINLQNFSNFTHESHTTKSHNLPLEISVIFVNENENGEKRENNEFVNEN